MQRYEIIIEPAALQEIDDAFFFIHHQSPRNAISWLAQLDSRIESLETMPNRCGLIRENEDFQNDVRELLHFSHRVIFTVDEERSLVLVHAVRHAARDEMHGGELEIE